MENDHISPKESKGELLVYRTEDGREATARVEYKKFAARRREYKEALGEKDYVKQLEEAVKVKRIVKKKAGNEGQPGYKETKVGWIPEELAL